MARINFEINIIVRTGNLTVKKKKAIPAVHIILFWICIPRQCYVFKLKSSLLNQSKVIIFCLLQFPSSLMRELR